MSQPISFDNLFFLDIETVPCQPNFGELDQNWQTLWEKKSRYEREKNNLELDDSYSKAGLYAEFGKIVCISVGFVVQNHEGRQLILKSFADHDEKTLLTGFADLLNKYVGKFLCAHNGKNFDFPFIAKRMVIQSISLPEALQLQNKKPWEIRHIDTMELWKFGSRNATSLELLAKVMGIPTPKDDIDGSMVAKVYYEDTDLDRIVRYCEKDVLVLVQVFLRFNGMELLSKDEIVHR